MAVLDDLFNSLSLRLRPEDVAELVRQELRGSLDRREARIINRAARGALTRQSLGASSMATEFARPIGLASQMHTARSLFPAQAAPTDDECDRPAVVATYIATTSRVIAKTPRASDFKADRLNRVGRTAAGLGELSKRQYNKRFRLLARMERKVETLEREIRKRGTPSSPSRGWPPGSPATTSSATAIRPASSPT